MDKPTDEKNIPAVEFETEAAREETPSGGPAFDVAVGEAAGDQVAELTARLQRLQADFDNFRRRSRAEAEQLSLYVTARLMNDFLPVMDNFERALSAGEGQDADSLRKGLEMIYRQLEKSMADAGVERIEALGAQFSPELHEAVMSSPNHDLPDGQIDLVCETGYRLKSRVIRHSKVRVVNNS